MEPWATWGSSREKPPVEAAASAGRSQRCPTPAPLCPNGEHQGAEPSSAPTGIPLSHPVLLPHAAISLSQQARGDGNRGQDLVAKLLCRAPEWQDPIQDAPRASGVAPHRGLLPCPTPSSPAWVLAGAGTGVCRGTGGSRRGAEPGPRASSIKHMICCGSFPAAWSQPRASTDDGFNCFQIR